MPSQKVLNYVLPWPPSVNTYWRRRGHQYFIGAKGQAFRKAVVESCSSNRPLTGRLFLTVTLYPPNRRLFDLDNHFKGILDALAHAGVYQDDSQIDRLSICRGHVTTGKGFCRVVVGAIERG